jgi:hypothetical protein
MALRRAAEWQAGDEVDGRTVVTVTPIRAGKGGYATVRVEFDDRSVVLYRPEFTTEFRDPDPMGLVVQALLADPVTEAKTRAAMLVRDVTEAEVKASRVDDTRRVVAVELVEPVEVVRVR